MADIPVGLKSLPKRAAALQQSDHATGYDAVGHSTASGIQMSGADLNWSVHGLLREPEVQLLMHADGIGPVTVMAECQAASHVRATDSSEVSSSTSNHDADFGRPDFRPGVGILLLNGQGQVLVARRADTIGEAWQMPQGGIDRGETPPQAALRELWEELGTDDVLILAESAAWLTYEVPPHLARRAWDGKWRGQRQKWFAMLLKGEDSSINLATHQPEFNAWRWVPIHELPQLAAPFKRQLYVDVLGQFAHLFRD